MWIPCLRIALPRAGLGQAENEEAGRETRPLAPDGEGLERILRRDPQYTVNAVIFSKKQERQPARQDSNLEA